MLTGVSPFWVQSVRSGCCVGMAWWVYVSHANDYVFVLRRLPLRRRGGVLCQREDMTILEIERTNEDTGRRSVALCTLSQDRGRRQMSHLPAMTPLPTWPDFRSTITLRF